MASGGLQSIIHVKFGDAVCEADNNCVIIVCTKWEFFGPKVRI